MRMSEVRKIKDEEFDIKIWKIRLRLITKEISIREKEYKDQYEENKTKIEELREEIRRLRDRMKFINSLDKRPASLTKSSIKSGEINILNIENVIEYLKQKLFDRYKEIHLLRHQFISKQQLLRKKTIQCKELEKCIHRTRTANKKTSPSKKKITKLENDCVVSEIKLQETIQMNRTYEDIKAVILQGQQYYTEQIAKLKQEIKEQKFHMNDVQLTKARSISVKKQKQNELKQTAIRAERARWKQKKQITKYKKKISKIKYKRTKSQKTFSSTPQEITMPEAKDTEEDHLNHSEIFEMIRNTSGISCMKELEERYHDQEKNRRILEKARDCMEEELRQLREKEKDLKRELQKNFVEKTFDESTMLTKLREKEEVLQEKNKQWSSMESEYSLLCRVLGEAKLSLKRICLLLSNALEMKNEILEENISIEELLEMCDKYADELLKSIKDFNYGELGEKVRQEMFQRELKLVNLPETEKELAIVEVSSDEDFENNSRMLMKEKTEKFVEAQTKNRSHRKQILRL